MVDRGLVDELERGLDYFTIHDMINMPRAINTFLTTKADFPDHIKKYVDKVWQDELAKRPALRDGDLFAINEKNIGDNGEVLSLPLYETKYRYLLGTRFNQTPGYSANLLGSGGVTLLRIDGSIIKSDYYFLFGKRSPQTAYVGGRIEVIPQGMLNKNDVDKSDSLDETIIREFQEEVLKPVGLDVEKARNIDRLKMALVMTPYWNSVAMDYVLSFNGKEIVDNCTREDKGHYLILHPKNAKEHTEFYAVPRMNIERFLDEHLNAKDDDEKLGVATRNRLKLFFSNLDRSLMKKYN